MNKINAAILIAMTILFISCKKDNENFTLNAQDSSAEWKGYLKNGYFNEGSVQVESNSIQVKNGIVTAGTFEMPLSSLKNFNLPTDTLKEQLIHHLKSADFFNMVLHPGLSFTIKSVTAYSGGVADAVAGANYMVGGSFVMLGKPLDISFPAKIDVTKNNISVMALLKIDRTRWGMNYATNDTLTEDKYIMPTVDIKLNLSGQRS